MVLWFRQVEMFHCNKTKNSNIHGIWSNILPIITRSKIPILTGFDKCRFLNQLESLLVLFCLRSEDFVSSEMPGCRLISRPVPECKQLLMDCIQSSKVHLLFDCQLLALNFIVICFASILLLATVIDHFHLSINILFSNCVLDIYFNWCNVR